MKTKLAISIRIIKHSIFTVIVIYTTIFSACGDYSLPTDVRNQNFHDEHVHGTEFNSISNMHPTRIINDARGAVLGKSQKDRSGKLKVFIDEEKILALSKNEIESGKISKDELLKSIRYYLETGTTGTAIGWPIDCYKVPCNGTCGWGPNCDGYWVCKWVGFAR